MAATEPGSPSRSSAEFVESSVLEAIVPAASSISVESLLQSWNGSKGDEDASILPFISQRQFLLFDELIPIYVVLRTPPIQESTLNLYLSRLAINLESYAISTASNAEAGEAYVPPAKELLSSETIKDGYEPTVVEHENGPSAHVYVIWKVDVFICRPRGRLQKPAIYFVPAASLKPPERIKRNTLEDDYLPSKVPTALNLLQPFENDPALLGTPLRLSALRISKVTPATPVVKELMRPIRSGLRRLFRAAPAIIWRIRYSRWQSSLNDTAIIASLDLEVAPITGCSVTIKEAGLTLQDGRVEPYVGSVSAGSGMICKPGDQFTLLYKIIPGSATSTASLGNPNVHTLDLRIIAQALASEGCHPNITVEWRTSVDFSMGLSTSIGRTAQLLSRSNQSFLPPNERPRLPKPDSLPSHDEHRAQEDDGSDEINISLTISGPSQVSVGDIFQWDVFIVNCSDKARKLAVLVIPKRRKAEAERHVSHPSTSSAGGRRDDKDEPIAKAVVDDNIVYARQKNSKLEPAELISLTTDVRIGHLSPGACYTAELKFLALSSGVLSVDALRVVDLSTQEATDIQDLPSVVVS